ncbi:flagellar biosynthetic protein FliO [Liquorilactobacillus nagelii]|uniref:flagellar biosynthetic protein FliO n=1 Tax=Liquorilactobacillus nagelii TaxID=82688 RepID=UPI001CCC69C8|nr:flagellar biosynthetic protein FliO [Liquorilactobacillus nagelii]ULQ48758.1 flagellar biosynthetic protein FliO [Liquorilactobacillus nagelii]
MEMLFTVVKLIIGLLIVVYLINIFLKFLNHYSLQTNKTFRILQKIPVSKSSSIGIVQIVDRVYVMSFSEQQNQILFEMPADEAKKLLAELQQTTTADPKKMQQSFATVLKRVKCNLENKKRK